MTLSQVREFISHRGSQVMSVIWNPLGFNAAAEGDILVSAGANKWKVLSNQGDVLVVRNLTTGKIESCKKRRDYWMVMKEEERL